MTTPKLNTFDAADYLNDEVDMALLLNEIKADGTASEIAAALDAVTRARGRMEIAKVARSN
jgi:probable addiction module antidote protein